MKSSTLYIILGIVVVGAIIYYLTNKAGATANKLAPKCCIEHDSLGNCLRWVWCSDTNATRIMGGGELDACIRRCKKDCPTCTDCNDQCKGIIGAMLTNSHGTPFNPKGFGGTGGAIGKG